VLDLLEGHRAPWLLLENVPFMLYLQKGRALRNIIDRLENLDYKWAYRIVDTRAFGLPQRRRRVFLLASLSGDPRDVLLSDDVEPPTIPHERNGSACGFYWTEGNNGTGWAVDAIPPLKGGSLVGIPSPPGIVLPSGKIVTPHIRDAERLQGLSPGWTAQAGQVKGASRSIRWRLVGNAVTTVVTRWIGRRLRAPVVYDTEGDTILPLSHPWPRAAWNVGKGRHTADVSEWPVCFKRRPLAQFLKDDGAPLSLKATQGFLDRVEASNLTVDDRFLAQLRKHISFMQKNGS
jgi:DNA (cytosine-5)-methyltransferase 1